MTREELATAKARNEKMDKILATATWMQVAEVKRLYAGVSDSQLLEDFYIAYQRHNVPGQECYKALEMRLEILRRMFEGVQA